MALEFSNSPAAVAATPTAAVAAADTAAVAAPIAAVEAATAAGATPAAAVTETAPAAPAAAGGFLDAPAEAPALGTDGQPVAVDAAAAAAKVTADAAAAVETAVGKMTAEEKAAYDALSAEDKVKRDGEIAEAAAKEAAKPVYAEFTLPADTKVDDALLTKAKGVFAEKGLSQDQAQAVIDLYSGDVLAAVAEAGKKPYDLWRTTQEGWQAEVKADPEIGGAKLQASMASAARAIDTFATTPEEAKELRAALSFTGATNNPAIVRFFARVGSRVSEGTFVAGNPPAPPPKTAAQVLFPNNPSAAG